MWNYFINEVLSSGVRCNETLIHWYLIYFMVNRNKWIINMYLFVHGISFKLSSDLMNEFPQNLHIFHNNRWLVKLRLYICKFLTTFTFPRNTTYIWNIIRKKNISVGFSRHDWRYVSYNYNSFFYHLIWQLVNYWYLLEI